MPESPEDDAAQGGRDRLLRSLFKPTRRQIIVGLLLALVGFAGVTQVRATEVDDDYASLRQQDLIDVLDGFAGARQRAEAEAERLREIRDGLSSTTNRTQTTIEQRTEEVETLNILAGLVPVTGSGIRITIEEVSGQVKLSSLLDVVQELRTVGAEAIQINGEVRVVAQTAFEDATGGFLVDGELVSPPYVIDVIGEPNVLKQSMTFLGGPESQVEDEGGTLVVEQQPSIDIESVREVEQPEYAEPDLGQ